MQTINEQLAKKIHDMAKEKGVVFPETKQYFYIEIEKNKHIRLNRYTTDELLEMLPEEIRIETKFGKDEGSLVLTKESSKYRAEYLSHEDNILQDIFHENPENVFKKHPTPSQALGELYLYCLENNLIK